MSESPTPRSGASRTLHGVLVADMTGFSRLMGEDESRAVAALVRIREVFTAVVPRHGGTLDVLVGDCFVALFDSAVEAVRAAIAIQTELAGATGPGGTAVRIRIGIHLGDVVRSGTEILGDSVNIAARLQTIARPGGIAVSEDVYRGVRNRVSVPFRDLGPKSLKNIREKIRIYELNVDDAATADDGHSRARSLRAVALTLGGAVLAAGVAALGYRLATQPTMLGVQPVTPAITQLATGGAGVENALSVGVTGVSARGDVPAWMQDSTRDSFNTLLSKVKGLRVFSREKIDFLRQRRGLSDIEVAETLNLQRMISGSLGVDGGDIVIDVRVIDPPTGVIIVSESVTGNAEDLIELQNQAASVVLNALGVQLSESDRAQLFARRSKATLEGYRALADTFGEAPESAIGPPEASDRRSWLMSWPRAAMAQEADPAEAPIRAVLEAYRVALEKKDLEAVAATHIELTPEQRTGFERYFGSADGLTVAISNVDVLIEGNEALLTFTRRDVFRDHKSGKEVELEVRLSSEVIQKNDQWLLRGVKRSTD
jgi:class 3 adenylate cyclase/TolB-like protein